MNYVITGAGFLGQSIAKYILDQKNNDTVTIVDKDEKSVPEGCTFIQENLLLSNTKLSKALEKCDCLLHTAAIASADAFAGPNSHCIENGILDTSVIGAVAACKNKPGMVLYFSSSEVYGENANKPEDTPAQIPQTWRGGYAAAKVQGEHGFASLTLCGIHVDVLRIFNVIGQYSKDTPKQNLGYVFSTFMENAQKNEPLQCFFNGEPYRCYMDIRDFCAAVVAIANASKEQPFDIWNVGSPKNKYTTKELAVLIKELTNSDSEIVMADSDRTEILKRKPNTKKLNGIFKPKYSTPQTIKHCLSLE